MFDFSKITDTLGGFLSANSQQAEGGLPSIADLLAQAGIDPALLDGLNQEEVMALLQQHGIDLSQFDPGQITEMFQQSDVGGNLANMAADWLRSRNG